MEFNQLEKEFPVICAKLRKLIKLINSIETELNDLEYSLLYNTLKITTFVLDKAYFYKYNKNLFSTILLDSWIQELNNSK
jgi:hypothetical protein